MERPREWRTYVAVGDSFTEGVGDPAGAGWRGWADRLAERLAVHRPGLRYANLAVRGLLLDQILDEQVPVAEDMEPDLVTVCAAGNDFLRPRVDPDRLADRLETAVARLRAGGADVVVFTSFDPRDMRLLHHRRGPIAIYNQHLHAIAQRHRAHLVDLWSMSVLRHPLARVDDRMHLSPEAHRRVALRVCEVLGLPVDGDWRAPWPDRDGRPWLTRRRDDLAFTREHLLPWAGERLRRRPAGIDRAAKRPHLLPWHTVTSPEDVAINVPDR
jgi:lysophospholipase L1-like esterase